MYEDEVFPLIKNRGPWRQAKKDERKKTPFAPPQPLCLTQASTNVKVLGQDLLLRDRQRSVSRR